ncbi:TIGR02646 family protein [Pseudomonas fluorescens]|jgi:uncharacterized protein (TIGR02646 family)|uniref:retron system putative HNH endonuclease n=1 Tax=Pseudomonas fluorescens TaxID=294 RepID=UPI000E25B1F8|nr:retron system putative HNH endonuclease [Pseudomonas fluorescens]MCO7625874.1 TIGR02646 family protein [Pseudomonas fluorescens]
MRHIVQRRYAGYHLDKSHENPPLTSEDATNRWGGFDHKQEVMGFLLSEQYSLCCYSELRADEHELGYHIEHVENKRQNPQRTFDCTNLAASALRTGDKAPLLKNLLEDEQAGVVFGGHAPGKQKSVDMRLFVSPHQPDCRRFFTYLSDGRVVPADGLEKRDEDRAQYTIDLLNLNSPFLLIERRRWWDELDEIFIDHVEQEMDLECLIGINLIPCNDKLYPFFSLTRSFFGRIAEDVIQKAAPQLI